MQKQTRILQIIQNVEHFIHFYLFWVILCVFQRIYLIGFANTVSKERQYKDNCLISNESDSWKCALYYCIFYTIRQKNVVTFVRHFLSDKVPCVPGMHPSKQPPKNKNEKNQNDSTYVYSWEQWSCIVYPCPHISN